MKIPSFFTVLLVTAVSLSAHATVTLHFNDAYTTGLPNNLANAAGSVSNGMRWGIVVSTTDGSFAGGGTSYDAYTIGSATAGFLSHNGAVTDDYYIPGTFTADGSFLAAGDGGVTAGNGSIVDDLVVSLTSGVSVNDLFTLIWFGSAGNGSAAGDKYGIFSSPSFVMTADGTDPIYGAAFEGNDPIRSASNTFQSSSPIPEPSRVLFLALGGMGLLMRRRRA